MCEIPKVTFVDIGKKKNTFFRCPFQKLTNLGPESCAKNDVVFRFLNSVLFSRNSILKFLKLTVLRHISNAMTPNIHLGLNKNHIANVNHRFDFVTRQGFF